MFQKGVVNRDGLVYLDARGGEEVSTASINQIT
jgi:hypothetical protein